MNRHEAIDRRDLELCHEAARLVDEDPTLLVRAREAVRRGLAIHADDPRSLPATPGNPPRSPLPTPPGPPHSPSPDGS
jgi:hypothetical protein